MAPLPAYSGKYVTHTAGFTPNGPNAPGYGQVAKLRGGAIGNSDRFRVNTLVPEAERRRQRAEGAATMFDQAIGDPEGTIARFGDIYRTAAEGIAAPALDDFRRQIGTVAGNVASRFGGNASTIETGAVNNAGRTFSQGLTDALARLAPQQAAQGLQYTGMLGNAAGQAEHGYDTSLDMLFRALGIQRQGEKETQSDPLGTITGIAGAAAPFFL